MAISRRRMLSFRNQRSNQIQQSYNHRAWKPVRRFLRFLLKYIGFSLLVRLDSVEGHDNIPREGAVVFLINHIAFIDPIAVLYVAERDIVPMAKVEVYELPFIGIFPKMWGVIPVKRDEFDRNAIRKAFNILNAGECLLIAPEGTRGKSLRKGKDGAAYLASRSNAAMVPVAIDGTVGFPAFRTSLRWKQPGAEIKFGRPFRYKPEFRHAKGDQLRLMTDEALYILAKMLPEHLRGEFSDMSKATQNTLDWL